ncbi:MAG: type IV pilus twitching motility protein PilT [Anaeromicrobium sp.]|jgi:twitching motility protein PilT|uniref:type IV pilus twitching motility protein PilT n=1 Tax=Anaeromicrobium sp. TaxID=1929132 RepID=UPI0025EB00D7|nr:type IV pilus twitching motility protein PilT [Anaeromicrobium sp.]MCT4595186.1 type IV pilus twitching motility protein PilT [Anaeromicrobium sp.]
MNIIDLLKKTVEAKASDLHITVAVPPVIRVNGNLERLDEKSLCPEDTISLAEELLTERQLEDLQEKGEIDISFSNPGLGRFRVNVYKQRGSYGIAVRSVALNIPTIEELGFPPVIRELSRKQRGLILVTGPTGSGKSTTLASMIDSINKERSSHILTLEDPIEYLHKHNKSIVNQREIGNDSHSFANALRAALRQDPDVILVGEMRDLETISIAITAAETGHLVLSTLHTIGAAKTIDRIIDIFPSNQQQQIRVQLSTVLEGIVSQQLLEKADGSGRVASLEIMTATTAIRNLIREGKTHQLQSSIQTGKKFGMKTMDNSLLELYNNMLIDRKTALTYAVDPDRLAGYMHM